MAAQSNGSGTATATAGGGGTALRWGGGFAAAAAIAAAAGLLGGWPRDAHPPGHAAHHASMSEAAAPGARAARPTTVAKPISCEKLAHVPGKSVTTVLVEFPPDAFTPRHRHGGSVTAYVLSGTIRSQLNDGPVETFTPGQTWFEPLGTIHSLVENASKTEPATLLATFVADDCAVLTTLID